MLGRFIGDKRGAIGDNYWDCPFGTRGGMVTLLQFNLSMIIIIENDQKEFDV